MNREEAGRGGGGRVGSGILENQQLAVCLLGEEELQEKGWGGGVLQGCSGLQSMDARRKDALASRAWMPAARMLWPPEHGCLLQGCFGPGLQSMDACCKDALAEASRASPLLGWKRKGSRSQESGNVVSGREDFWAETASSLRRRFWRSVLLRPRGKRD